MVDALYRDFPLKTLLSAMGIKRSSYYHRQSRHRQAHDLLHTHLLPAALLPRLRVDSSHRESSVPVIRKPRNTRY